MAKKNPSLIKIVKFAMTLIIPILLLMVYLFIYTYYRAVEQTNDRINSMLQYQIEEVDIEFDQLNDYMVDTMMTSRDAEIIRGSTKEDNDYYRAARSLQSEIGSMQQFINSGYTFYCYYPKLNVSFRSSQIDDGYLTDHKVVKIINKEIDEGNHMLNDTRWEYREVDGLGYMVQVLCYEEMYLCCWIRTDMVFTFIDDLIQSPNGFYSIVTRSSRALTNNSKLEEMKVELAGSKTTCGKRGYLSSHVSTPHMNVGFVVVDRQELDMNDAWTYITIVAVIFIVVLGFSFYIIYYFRHYIQEPLEFFQNHINSYLQERRFSKRYGFAELDEVENAFSALETQVRELKIDVYEEKIRRTRTELEYLQNQIKPHFFVNCFSIIYGMAERQQFDRIQEFCLTLSRYVRYLLTGSFNKVPLEREMSQIKEFLSIQNIRFHASNQLDSDIDEELLDCLIPPVTLLTFVENTVKHNKFKRDDLSVTVSAEEVLVDKRVRMRMRVADNGIGLSTEALAASKELLVRIRKATLNGGAEPETGKDGSHIGLANVYRRLLMLYGDRADMDIASEADVGTVVTITIPIEREGEPDQPKLNP